MLALCEIPEKYLEWNRRHGAPFGFQVTDSCTGRLLRKLHLLDPVYKWNPFAFQTNNSTRIFEYPWAFYANFPAKGKILEIGGGMSGFQFVLSRDGCHVTNVDPGRGWSYDDREFTELNKRFGTSVELRPTTIDKADLEDNDFDCVYSISVLEHVAPSEMISIMNHVWRCLKPGGRFVLTVDLFINLRPFTRRVRNEYGENVDIKWLLEQAPFILEQGSAEELFGFDEFDYDTILSKLETYLIGTGYPALTQCLVLRKPS